MEKFIWILVFFSLKAYGEAQPVQEPTEIHELSVTEQGYKKIWDRFQRLNAMNQSEWTKSSGRWLQTEFWPEPNKLKSLLGVNPEEFVVEASPTLKVTKNFFTSDEKNFGTFSIFKIPDVQKWKCLGADCGWVSAESNYLLSCKKDSPANEILCLGMSSKKSSPKTGGTSLGKVITVFKKREPGMKLQHIRVTAE